MTRCIGTRRMLYLMSLSILKSETDLFLRILHPYVERGKNSLAFSECIALNEYFVYGTSKLFTSPGLQQISSLSSPTQPSPPSCNGSCPNASSPGRHTPYVV